MKNSRGFLALVTFLSLGAAGGFRPAPLLGQGYTEGYSFKAPKVTLSFNVGYGIPTAGSDIFDEATTVFTLEKSDFHSAVVGGGVSVFLHDRVDLAFEVSYSQASTWSEYVDWVDDMDLPIEQETSLVRVPLTLSVKYFLMDRGRQIGSLSWVSTTWAPYIGIGGGGIWYEWEQVGEFVDFVDQSIFPYTYVSDGWTWVGDAFGGVQWAVSPRWVVTAEGRYSFADQDLDRPDYKGYEPIDLSGFKGSVGFGVRF